MADIDMDEMKQKFEGMKGGGSGAAKIILVVILVVVAISTVADFFFQVNAESVGVVTRFGTFNRTVDPGLHLKFPFVEEVHIVETERQHKEEFGFRTVGSKGGQSEWVSEPYIEESLMLTGDLNVIEVAWAVQYRITDPYNYLFRVRNVKNTLRYMSEAVMREIIGDRTVNEALTSGRVEIALANQEKLQELCKQYEIGLTIDQVILLDITPPDAVKPSFNLVNQAQQEKEKLINQARAEYNAEVPRAAGEAEQTIQQARGYAVSRINRAEGEASRFKALVEEYRKAPVITRQRIYLESMGEVLPKIGQRVLTDQNGPGMVPLMNFSQQGGKQ